MDQVGEHHDQRLQKDDEETGLDISFNQTFVPTEQGFVGPSEANLLRPSNYK